MKSRKLIESLISLRDNFIEHKRYFQKGLCMFINDLYSNGVIDFGTWSSYVQVLGSITPEGSYLFKYWFPSGDYDIRLKYLNQKIEELSK